MFFVTILAPSPASIDLSLLLQIFLFFARLVGGEICDSFYRLVRSLSASLVSCFPSFLRFLPVPIYPSCDVFLHVYMPGSDLADKRFDFEFYGLEGFYSISFLTSACLSLTKWRSSTRTRLTLQALDVSTKKSKK
ncbi:uncharacterized protein [Triticum aestivum]|uniref:uncharacterized protein n=1 Tax=Triticum aestivum TaxID=4565 RepID=UPI001ABCE43B|nr:uncharacterized protein LOC120973462 [Aegilops tauschii subsp. strangulata]XP_044335583.1 uncharacterized protein LOC123055793 [Triticum aestivum]